MPKISRSDFSFLNSSILPFALGIFSVLVLILLGCADRDRVNPLDPKNPETEGKPTGLKAVAEQNDVRITWDRIPFVDLTGIQVFRKAGGDGSFERFAVLPPSAFSYEDASVTQGVEYTYQISAIGEDFESMRSDSVVAEPGPTINWVADNPIAAGRLLQLSHDARTVLHETVGFLRILDLEPDPLRRQIWTIDFITSTLGQIIRVSFGGRVLQPFVNLKGPRDLALDLSSGSVWVADARDSSVVKLDADGQIIFQARLFESPVSVSVDPRNKACWIADAGSNRISRLSSNGANLRVSPVAFSSLVSLEVDPNDGSVWVSDKTAVFKLNEGGEVVLQIPRLFTAAERLAVDGIDGNVWVLDSEGETLSKFDSAGAFQFEIGGFSTPTDIDVSSFDHSCLVADSGNDRIVRISAAGSESKSVQTLAFPTVVAIQN